MNKLLLICILFLLSCNPKEEKKIEESFELEITFAPSFLHNSIVLFKGTDSLKTISLTLIENARGGSSDTISVKTKDLTLQDYSILKNNIVSFDSIYKPHPAKDGYDGIIVNTKYSFSDKVNRFGVWSPRRNNDSILYSKLIDPVFIIMNKYFKDRSSTTYINGLQSYFDIVHHPDQSDTTISHEYKATPNSLARINLKLYGSKKFDLNMTLFASEHEEGSKNEDLEFNGVWEETKNELILKFTGEKPHIEAIFDKNYSEHNEFRIINDSTVSLNKDFKMIYLYGVGCEKISMTYGRKKPNNKITLIEETLGINLPENIKITKGSFKGDKWENYIVRFKAQLDSSSYDKLVKQIKTSKGYQCDNSPVWRINYRGDLGKQKGIWKCDYDGYLFYVTDYNRTINAILERYDRTLTFLIDD